MTITPQEVVLTIVVLSLTLPFLFLDYKAFNKKPAIIRCEECHGIFPMKGAICITGYWFCPKHGDWYQESFKIGPYEKRHDHPDIFKSGKV